ncbi:hypothetical protein [Phenylobacterium sp.]|uniref:hypothetical protein n=1 Tax=Phenylobacterium sp. TaxID=1871053 RepID=UPI00286B2B37|nr:hypothetical protein [Phenylobacterium sp.]
MASRVIQDSGHLRRFSLAHAVIAVVVATSATALLTYNFVRDRKADVATARAWDIQGPPCPGLTQAQFTAQGYKAQHTFDYDGVTIGRHSGDANCSDVKQAGGKGLFNDKVCQFTSPATLTVTSRAGTYFFVPGVGQPATLAIHRDIPRCVMASKFTLKTE